MKFLFVLLVALLAPASVVLADEETSKQGVQAIIALYQARDFSALIRERYTEIYKAETVGKVDELVEKFSLRLADEGKLNRVIELYTQCLDVAPVVTTNPNPRETETPSMATYTLGEDTFNLYLQKTGKWGFHM